MLKNKHSLFKFAWLVVLALSCLLITTINTIGQNADSNIGNGLRISPVRQELILTPGQKDTYTIELTNVSPGDMTVTTVVNDFESDGVTGQPKLLVRPDESSPFSLKAFLDLPEPFFLGSGDKKTVTISVNIPSDISAGGYFGAIRFAPVGGEGVEEGNVALTASVGSLLLVTVPGDVPEGMTLDSIRAKSDNKAGTFFENPPNMMSLALTNTGNTILKPFGQVTIKDIFGNEVYGYEFNGGQLRANVLPQSSRTFDDEIHNIGRIGRYTVEANLSFGEGGGTILSGKTTFWVIPWKILLAVIAIIAVAIWFATRGIKTYNRRVVERAKRNS